jgi:hypothetical protein
MTFDLAQVKCSFTFIGPSTGLRQRWQNTKQKQRIKYEGKGFAIIHTYIHSFIIHLGLLFRRDLGNGEKEVWKFGHLGYYYVQVRKEPKTKAKKNRRKKKKKLIFKEAHL